MMTDGDVLRLRILQQKLVKVQEFIDQTGPHCDDPAVRHTFGYISNTLTSEQIGIETLLPEEQTG